MACGGRSVMTSGTTEMLVWCADSWDTPHMVWNVILGLESTWAAILSENKTLYNCGC